MPALPPPSQDDLLRQLKTCTDTLHSLIDSQPVLATQLAAALRQELAELLPDQPLDPDAVFLNEYAHELTSQTLRLTRSRNLTQVLLETIVTGAAPTRLVKATTTEDTTAAMGFYPSAFCVGMQDELAALELEMFNAVIDDLRENALAAYQRQLQAFWSSPHPLTGSLSVHEAVSQQQRELLRIEADLKRAANGEPADEAERQRLNEGRQLIENLLLHETSGTTTPPRAFSIALHDYDTPAWSAALNGAFILTERLHSARPAVLYTPQWGGECFDTFSNLQNTLSKRLVSGADKHALLTHVPAEQRATANQLLRRGQNLRFTPITGPVFSECLLAHRRQQQADIAHAFSTPPATFEALAAALQASLTLPSSGIERLRGYLPAVVEPVLANATAHTAPDSEQQKQLIRLWDSLNEQIGFVLDKARHPTLDSVLSALLEETFAHLPTETRRDALHVNHYRTDSAGMRHLESSHPLREALLQRLPEADWTLDETADAPHAYAVFSDPSGVAEAEQVAWSGTLHELVAALRARLATQITAYWRTPIAPGLACPQTKLIELQRQCLDVQARLRFVDNTLGATARQLIERALHHTTQARREARFNHGQRPGVYQLTLASPASPQGERLAACFVLTPNDGAMATRPHWPNGHKNLSTQGTGGSTVQGPVVLYTPSQGFEEFATLHTLHTTLAARFDAGQETGRLLSGTLPIAHAVQQTGLWGSRLSSIFRPIEGDFIADSVHALLNKQLDDVQTLLAQAGPSTEAAADCNANASAIECNGRAALVELLDMSTAFMARNQLLLDQHRPDWEKHLSAADRTRLHERTEAALQKQQALARLWAAVPALSEYAKQQVLSKIAELPALKTLADQAPVDCAAPQVDPDRTLVTRTTRVRVAAGTGFGSTHQSIDTEHMSLTQLILKNTRPWTKSLSWTADDTVQATLADSTGQWVRDRQGKPITLTDDVLEQWLKALDVGPRYIDNVLKPNLDPDATSPHAQALKDAWMAAQAATLSHAALLAELNPDAYSTPLSRDGTQKKAAAWVAAVLEAPQPHARRQVDGQPVIAAALMFNPASDAPEGRGGQPVNGVLVISTAVDAPAVLYTPNAPDGQVLREIGSEDELVKLTRHAAWQAYLNTRLPSATRLLNPRLATHTGDFLAALYRQNYLHLVNQADEQTLSNEELEQQSTFNKVVFGVEVALLALGALPGAGHFASSSLKWLAQVGSMTLQTLRKLGRNIPGLIVRHGFAGQVMVEMATTAAPVAATARSAGIGLRPLPLVLGSGAGATRSMNPTLLSGYEREFQRQGTRLAVPGGIPAGASLSEGSGIYRAPGSPTTLLVRSTQASGEELVLRIQDAFNLYDPNGVVARVLTPSGATTPFRVRRVEGTQRWSLDTLERLPGGGPATTREIDEALRQWQVHFADPLSHTPGQSTKARVAAFFTERGIQEATWNKYVKQSGELSRRGLERLTFTKEKALSDEVFMRWVETPDKTPESAVAFREANRVRREPWTLYVQADGNLTLRGMARQSKILVTRMTGRTNRVISDKHLKTWYERSLDPAFQNRQAMEKFAIENNIHLTTWYRYVAFDGSFKPFAPLTARLRRLNIPVAESPAPGPSTASA